MHIPLFLPLFFLMFSVFSSSHPYYETVSSAHGAYYEGNYDSANELFLHAFEASEPLARDLIVAVYSAAFTGEIERAIVYFEQYLKARPEVYLDLVGIETHPAITGLFGNEEWNQVWKKALAHNKQLEPSLNNTLRMELEHLYELDQQTRNRSVIDSLIAKHGFPSEPVSDFFKKMNAQDALNLAKFNELVSEEAIPGISEVGEKANLVVWLIIQHNSTQTQKRYKEALIRSAEKGETPWMYVAGTIDRIMMEEEGLQLYGTQFGLDENQNAIVKPIKDPHLVNQRRKKVGLIALEDDAKRHGIEWTASTD